MGSFSASTEKKKAVGTFVCCIKLTLKARMQPDSTAVSSKGQCTLGVTTGQQNYLRQREGMSHTVIVDDGAYQLVLLQHGEVLQGSGFAEDVTALQAITSCNQIVQLDSHPVIRQLPPPRAEAERKGCSFRNTV